MIIVFFQSIHLGYKNVFLHTRHKEEDNNQYTISKIMHHSSVAVTEIYANLINKKRDEVADIINIELTEDDIKRKNENDKKKIPGSIKQTK